MILLLGALMLIFSWSMALGAVILLFRGEIAAMIGSVLFAWVAGAIGKFLMLRS